MMNDLSPILDETEWDFSERVLPDEEVRACLIWECGRESPELWQAKWAEELLAETQPTRWDQEARKHIKNSRAKRQRALEWLRDLDFDLDGHRDRLFHCHQAFNHFYSQVAQYAAPWAKPWRAMPEETRKQAVRDLNDHGIYPPVRTARLGELESLWTSSGSEIIAIKSGAIQPTYDDTLEMLAFEDTGPIEVSRDVRDPEVRELTTALTINFSLFTNREIVAAFTTWLQEARVCPEPVRRGKKTNDDRAALEGIGMMRAMHHWPFSHPAFPAKLKSRGRKACEKGRKLARRRFHELLPFHVADSNPITWDKWST